MSKAKKDQIRVTNDSLVDLKNALESDAYNPYAYKNLTRLTNTFLTQKYKSNELVSKIVDVWAEQSMKKEPEVPEKLKPIWNYIASNDLGLLQGIEKALKLNNLLGASLVILFFSGDRIDDPMYMESEIITKRGQNIVGFNIYEEVEITRIKLGNNGKPEYFTVTTEKGVMTVHESRCLYFDGKYKTEKEYRLNGYKGESFINGNILEAIETYSDMVSLLPHLISDSTVNVMRMNNFNRIMGSKNDKEKDALIEVIRMRNIIRNILGTQVLDKEDEFQRFSVSNFSGISDLIDKQKEKLIALSNIPHTHLFNEAPQSSIGGQSGGLQEDIFNDRVITYIRRYLVPVYNKLFVIVSNILGISLKKHKDKLFEIKDLTDLTELEEAQEEKLEEEAKKLKQETLTMMVNNIALLKSNNIPFEIDEEGCIKLLPMVADDIVLNPNMQQNQTQQVISNE